MPNDHDHDHAHGHEHHNHSHGDHDVDPALEAGWEALEAGDLEAARAAARAAIDGEAPAGKKKSGAKGRKPPGASEGDDDEDRRARLIDGLLLDAACAREEDDVEGALASLGRIAKEDPEWCTPELWTAEILSADEQRRDEALRHARKAVDLAEEEDDYLAALALKAAIELDLGRPTEARKTLEGLPEADVALDDPMAALQFAELLMDAGDAEQARARLLTLTATQPDLADGWYLLGACAEMLDDEQGKRGAWIKTRELDLEEADDEGESDERRPTLSEEALVAAAEETLAALPDELRAQLKDVPIVVAEVPAAADVAAGLDPRLLGLFSGSPHAEAGGVMAPAELTEILLFRRNLERMGLDEEELREEVRVTLLHEAGHFFGLDHDALEKLGLD
jgi:predicted Zn-dependent protease with MMP-like domain